MLLSEEELSIEVTEIYRIEIDNVDFTETGENKILEQFAADSAGADQEHARLHRHFMSSSS